MTSLNPYCSGQWSRTKTKDYERYKQRRVLILIVMEDGLVPLRKEDDFDAVEVLILIVVDNGLVLLCTYLCLSHISVLILIVVDNGLVLL